MSFARSISVFKRQLHTSSCRYISTSRQLRNDPTPKLEPSPKIAKLVDEISKLTLIEAGDLVTLLKSSLNIVEIASAPISSAASSSNSSSASQSEEKAEEEEKPKEKTIFTLKLEKWDATAKAKVIREIKSIMPSMNLVEAKKFVEGAPGVIRNNVPKEEAEKLKAQLEAVGATVVLE